MLWGKPHHPLFFGSGQTTVAISYDIVSFFSSFNSSIRLQLFCSVRPVANLVLQVVTRRNRELDGRKRLSEGVARSRWVALPVKNNGIQVFRIDAYRGQLSLYPYPTLHRCVTEKETYVHSISLIARVPFFFSLILVALEYSSKPTNWICLIRRVTFHPSLFLFYAANYPDLGAHHWNFLFAFSGPVWDPATTNQVYLCSMFLPAA